MSQTRVPTVNNPPEGSNRKKPGEQLIDTGTRGAATLAVRGTGGGWGGYPGNGVVGYRVPGYWDTLHPVPGPCTLYWLSGPLASIWPYLASFWPYLASFGLI